MKGRLDDDESADRLRCFVAVLLNAAVLDELVAVQRLLRRTLKGPVRWTQPEQMHLTLCFLGDVVPEHLEALNAALERVIADARPIELHVHGLGVFPEQGRPRVIWAGLEGELQMLHNLQQTVADCVRPFGSHQEGKGFHPHLTLGRLRPDPGLVGEVFEVLRSTPGPRPVRWRVGELTLMSSELSPVGAHYTVMNTLPIGIADDSAA